ncbi:MAG: hypothetical protein ACWA44_00050 [Thiotrichales bacterium]
MAEELNHAITSCSRCGGQLTLADRITRNIIQKFIPRSGRFECRACGHKQFRLKLSPEFHPATPADAANNPNPPSLKLPATEEETLRKFKIANAQLKKRNEFLLQELARVQKEKRALKKVNELLRKLSRA